MSSKGYADTLLRVIAMDSNSKVINLIKCQRCNVEWIEESHEIYCPKCMRDAEADMAVTNIFVAIQRANSHCTSESLAKRLDVIEHSLTYLKAMIKTLKNNHGK